MLVKHIEKLTQNRNNLKFLLPLCGKTVDMAWMSSLGHKVVGVELVKDAAEQFFSENNFKYRVKETEDFKIFMSENDSVRIYCGDFFKFSTDYETLFDCVWDRAALVALPADLRAKYAEHVQKLLKPDFRYLLDVFDYDASLYSGPPHMVTLAEIQKLYGSRCKIEQIDNRVLHYQSISETLEKTEPKEIVYMLSNF